MKNTRTIQIGECLIEDCNKPKYCRGMCSAHYQRSYLKGDRAPKQDPICSIDHCQEPCAAKGLCKAHYQISWKSGNQEKTKSPPKPSKKEPMNAKKTSHLKLVPKDTELPPMPLQFMDHPTFGRGLVISDQGESVLIKFSDGTQRRIYKQYLYPCKGDQ